MAALQDVQLRKKFWENLGARFALATNGDFDVTYSSSLIFDSRAKRDLGKFCSEHHRELQALVVADGDQVAINRFESVQWAKEHGRFTEEVQTA